MWLEEERSLGSQVMLSAKSHLGQIETHPDDTTFLNKDLGST